MNLFTQAATVAYQLLSLVVRSAVLHGARHHAAILRFCVGDRVRLITSNGSGSSGGGGGESSGGGGDIGSSALRRIQGSFGTSSSSPSGSGATGRVTQVVVSGVGGNNSSVRVAMDGGGAAIKTFRADQIERYDYSGNDNGAQDSGAASASPRQMLPNEVMPLLLAPIFAEFSKLFERLLEDTDDSDDDDDGSDKSSAQQPPHSTLGEGPWRLVFDWTEAIGEFLTSRDETLDEGGDGGDGSGGNGCEKSALPSLDMMSTGAAGLPGLHFRLCERFRLPPFGQALDLAVLLALRVRRVPLDVSRFAQ